MKYHLLGSRYRFKLAGVTIKHDLPLKDHLFLGSMEGPMPLARATWCILEPDDDLRTEAHPLIDLGVSVLFGRFQFLGGGGNGQIRSACTRIHQGFFGELVQSFSTQH